MVRPDREVQLNLHLQDWERGDQHHHHQHDGRQHSPLIQVGVFVNSVPARVRMTVCDSGKLNFVNSSSGADNELSHEDLEELNLKPGENNARLARTGLYVN